MAFTITNAELAVAIRAATDETSVTAPVAKAISYIALSAKALIERYAPAAPEPINDQALIRLAGYLYDSDPTDPRAGAPMIVSGAAPLLAPWRNHYLGVIDETGAEIPVIPPGDTGNVPEPPAGDGRYILQSIDGVLTWVSFPAP